MYVCVSASYGRNMRPLSNDMIWLIVVFLSVCPSQSVVMYVTRVCTALCALCYACAVPWQFVRLTNEILIHSLMSVSKTLHACM